MEIWQICRKN